MNAGVCKIRLHIPESQSLKEKRRVVKSITSRIRNQFNISVAEVGDYDRSRVTDYIFLGTRWHYSDYYSVILDELTDIYDILKLACWDDETHEPLFGEKYTREMLEGIRIEKLTSPHPEEWSNQWLNEPQDSATATFKREYFQWRDGRKKY